MWVLLDKMCFCVSAIFLENHSFLNPSVEREQLQIIITGILVLHEKIWKLRKWLPFIVYHLIEKEQLQMFITNIMVLLEKIWNLRKWLLLIVDHLIEKEQLQMFIAGIIGSHEKIRNLRKWLPFIWSLNWERAAAEIDYWYFASHEKIWNLRKRLR